jgi:glucose/arabinose dehydrogenase
MTPQFRYFVPVFAGFLALAPAYAADAPGQHFEILPASLPAPHASPAVDNSSSVVPRPTDAIPQAPQGFTVSLFASGLTHPRFLAVAPNGDVFLAESDAKKITVFAPDGSHRSTFVSGLNKPHGIAFHGGALYVADMTAVYKFDYKDGQRKAGAKTRLTKTTFPEGGHFTRDIAFGPDGKLYLGIGSNGNVEENPLPRAAVSVVEPDGSLAAFTTGLRNPVGLAFYPGTNDLWVTVNERDGLGDDLPPDYLTHIAQGEFFGWPYAYIGPHPDPDLGSKKPAMIGKTKTPDLLFQAHSAPLGLLFYEGSQFPADYKGDAFVALHGSWNSAKPTGYKVVRVKFKDGKPVGGYDNFLTGFHVGETSPAQVWGRPVGLATAKDGSLLVTDDAGKAVWRVAYTGK